MFAALTACFALVLGVAAFAALALLTSRVSARITDLDSRCRTLAATVTMTTPKAIVAEVDDLRGALDVMRASNRKEFGSIWGRLGGRPRAEEGVTLQLGAAANDSSFDAMLALQGTPPVKPT